MADKVVVGDVEVVVSANLDQLRAITPQVEAEAKRLYDTFSRTSAASEPLKHIEENLRRLADVSRQVNANLVVKDNFGYDNRAADIEAYGNALNALRGRFNPLFQAQLQYRTYLHDIDEALATGAINENEHNGALERGRAAFERKTQAILAHTDALRQSQQNTINETLGVKDDFNTESRSADIAAYGAELNRLQAQFDPVFRAQQEYQNRIDEISRALAMGAISEQVYSNAIRQTAAAYAVKTSSMQSPVQPNLSSQIDQSMGVPGGTVDYAARAKDLEEYSQNMDTLRARLSPAFAAQQRFNQAIDQASQALKVGAINQEEFWLATMRAESALNTENEAIDRSNHALLNNHGMAKMNALQIQNMGFQINDIAMGLMTGANPFVLITQQGLQIAQIFKPGATLMAGLKEFGTGVLNFITNPINIAVVGLAAAAFAATALWSAVQGDKNKAADGALERHRGFIDDLSEGYKHAKDAADEYFDKVNERPVKETITSSKVARQDLQEDLDRSIKQITAPRLFLDAIIYSGQFSEAVIENAKRIVDLQQNLKSGDISAAQFTQGLLEIRLDKTIDKNIRDIATELSNASSRAIELQNEIGGIGAAIAALDVNGLVNGTFKSLPGTDDALEQVRALTPDLRTPSEKVRDVMNQNSGAGRTLAENEQLRREGEFALEQIAEQDRRAEALRQARKNARGAEGDAKQRAENLAYLADLEREVEVLGMNTAEREKQMRLLEEQRAIQAAIRGLGDQATPQQIAEIQRLIPQKLEMIRLNEEEEDSLKRQSELYSQLGGKVGDLFNQWADGSLTAEQAMWQLARAAAMAAIQSQFMGQSNNEFLGDGTFLGSVMSSMFGGGRANGGPVQAGKIYRVNEGTEKSELWMPTQNGVVVPHNENYSPVPPSSSSGDNFINIDLNGANGDSAIEDAVNRGIQGAMATLPGRVQQINVRGKQQRKRGFRP